MAKELKTFDVSNAPDVRKLAEEVQATQEPQILRRDKEDLAIVSPIRRAIKRPSRSRPIAAGDSLWNLVGAGESTGDADTSDNKHKYLADAYQHRTKAE